MKRFIFLLILLVFISFTVTPSIAKEVTDIEGMLDKAENLNVLENNGSFMICLLSENSESLVKFKVKDDGNYIIMTKNNGVDFQGQLLTRNFNYELIVECTDFNIPEQKRFFNCEEELTHSKTYYLYFNTIGHKPRLGCAKITITKK